MRRGGSTVARLVYQANGTPRESFAFHRKQLVDDGWQPAPNETVTDESAAGTFTRKGSALSLSASSSGGYKPSDDGDGFESRQPQLEVAA